MVNPNRFYTYAYLREDKTPYYIGKGQRKRIYQKSRKPCPIPKDKSRIIFLKQNLTEEEAFKHEIYMIAVFGRKDLGTGILLNKTNGGDGTSGILVSDERRKRIGEVHRGRKLTEEHRRKMSEAHKGEKNHFYGKNHTEEAKRRIREKLQGKKLSEERKRKMSEARKGKTLSEEHKRNLSKSHLGKTLSEEHRRKISEARKILNSQRWKCLVTGHISNASGLARYQKSRGIDTTQRVRVK